MGPRAQGPKGLGLGQGEEATGKRSERYIHPTNDLGKAGRRMDRSKDRRKKGRNKQKNKHTNNLVAPKHDTLLRVRPV